MKKSSLFVPRTRKRSQRGSKNGADPDTTLVDIRVRGKVPPEDLDWVCACIATAGFTPRMDLDSDSETSEPDRPAASKTLYLDLDAPGRVTASRRYFAIPHDESALLHWLCEDLFAPELNEVPPRLCITHDPDDADHPWASFQLARALAATFSAGPPLVVDASTDQSLVTRLRNDLIPEDAEAVPPMLDWDRVCQAIGQSKSVPTPLTGLNNLASLGGVRLSGSAGKSGPTPNLVIRLIEALHTDSDTSPGGVLVDAGPDIFLAADLRPLGYAHVNIAQDTAGFSAGQTGADLLLTSAQLPKSLRTPKPPSLTTRFRPDRDRRVRHLVQTVLDLQREV